MLDFITPILALVPYFVILAALAAIPTDALLHHDDADRSDERGGGIG